MWIYTKGHIDKKYGQLRIKSFDTKKNTKFYKNIIPTTMDDGFYNDNYIYKNYDKVLSNRSPIKSLNNEDTYPYKLNLPSIN